MDNPDKRQEVLDIEVCKERVIVEKEALLKLFKVCSFPSCGSVVDPDDVTVHTVGAAITVTATCLQNNHEQTWSSSNTVGEGRNKMFTINVLLAAFTLFCGLNISQVSHGKPSKLNLELSSLIFRFKLEFYNISMSKDCIYSNLSVIYTMSVSLGKGRGQHSTNKL
jgi:hypothetical protein